MHPFRRLSVLLVAFAVTWVSLALPVAVSAQEDTPTPAATTPPATPTPDIRVLVTNDATAIPLDPGMALALVLVLLLIALFALSEIFRYLREGRADYYNTFREFARKGVFVEPVTVHATASQAPPVLIGANGEERESGQLPQVFRMSGPGMLATSEQGTFTAFMDDTPAAGTKWTLSAADGAAVPATVAKLDPQAGTSTTFTASRPGVYRLAATPAGNPNLLVEMAITVVEPPAPNGEAPKLPFIGEGYGSIVGAILLLAVVVVLAATRAIDADIIGVLLGSIAGYLFGVGINRGTS